MSFGGSVYLVLLVPVVNLLMMPAAVAGATLFWVREQGAEEWRRPKWSSHKSIICMTHRRHSPQRHCGS